MNSRQPVILYFLPVTKGGLTRYAEEQTKVLSERSEIHLAGYEGHITPVPGVAFYPLRTPQKSSVRSIQALGWMLSVIVNAWQLRQLIKQIGPDYVLIGAFAEYFSPLWVWMLKKTSLETPFGCILHDPVRDHVVGPNWWHAWSVRLAFGLMRDVFVHQNDDNSHSIGASVVRIPHGIYNYPEEVGANRQDLEIPEDAFVILCFGHIRDGKNLNLLIEAIALIPDLHLLVVGKEQSSQDKKLSFYREMADRLEVVGRCHFVNRFVHDEEVSGFFRLADCLALTYSADFHSASGVLNSNVQFGLPVVASGGEGPLSDAIERYNLGVFVQPDNLEALVEGITLVRNTPPQADWGRYRQDHSWYANASIVLEEVDR